MEDRFSHLLDLWHTGLVMDPELIAEMLELSPPDAKFLALPTAHSFGVYNLEQFHANIGDIQERHRRAMEHGCYIEVITIRVQHIELWLRMYWAAKNPGGKVFGADDRRTFGMIINDCADIGLPEKLERDLQRFNDVRIDSVHKYVLGDIRYDELRVAASNHADLDERTVDYVLESIARPATLDDFTRGRGSIILAPAPRGAMPNPRIHADKPRRER